MVKKIRDLISSVYLVVYIFWFLFAPPLFSGINSSILLAIFSSAMLFFKYRKETLVICKDKRFKKVSIFMISYILVYLISWLLAITCVDANYYDNGVLNIYSFLLNFGATFICAIYLVVYCSRRKIDNIEIMKYFVYAGVLQLVIALIALVSPEFKQLTLDLMMKETNESLLKSTWITSRRFYGFSNNLLDLFGFGCGIIAILPLFYATLKNKKLFMLWSPILLTLSILNARTGIVIYAIGIIVWLLGFAKNNKINVLRIIIIIPTIILGLFASYRIVDTYSPDTISWVRQDLLSFVDKDVAGTADELYSDNFWTIPKGSDIIIGTGHNISAYSGYKAEGSVYSDVGYINELWKVGIIGLFLYLMINYLMLKISYDEGKGILKSLYIFFGVSIAAFLVKGSLMGYNPGNVIIYTMFIFAIYDKKTAEKK